MRFQVEKTWFGNVSFVRNTRLKKSSSTEFNENWLDSWEYAEERLEFFLEFSVHTPLQRWALKRKKRDSKSQKCHKMRDLKTCTRQNSTESNLMVRCYSSKHLEFFFQNFPSISRSSSGLQSGKNAILSFKTSENICSETVSYTHLRAHGPY